MKNPLDYFDAIYCINLDRRIDRWKHMLIQFEKLGIADRVQRFSAIDCDTNKKRGDIAKQVYGVQGPSINYKWPIPPAVGVATSHREILIKAREDKLKNVLVLEDDIEVLDNWKDIMECALTELDKHIWHLFYLAYEFKDNGMPYKLCGISGGNFEGLTKKIGDNLLTYSRGYKHKGVNGAWAIAYNSDVYDRLIESINPFNRVATGRVGHFDIGLRRMSNLKRFMCNPPCLKVCGGSLGVGDIHNAFQLKKRKG